jgi:hypothetical protein
MPAIHKDLTLEQGVQRPWGFTVTGANGTPVDLTGCTAKLQVRLTVSEPTPYIELSTANGRIVLGGAAGTVNITFEPSDTQTQTFRQAVYDLMLYWPSGSPWRLFQGVVTLERVVTRA